MTRVNVALLTDEELIERFVAIALEQDYVERMDEPVSEYNRLYDLMEEVEGELKSRGGDRRSLLLPLYAHENAHVRLKAALATLAVAPEASRDVLQKLSDRNRPPEASNARRMLRALDEGRYIPT
jgi:Domain of unknown function (DUF2019)